MPHNKELKLTKPSIMELRSLTAVFDGPIAESRARPVAEPAACSYNVVCAGAPVRVGHRAANLKKHKVSFDEAQTAFLDEEALVIEDPDHSEAEDRFILLGLSAALRVLFVCHCVRESGPVIRIISARKANRSEQDQYSERLRR